MPGDTPTTPPAADSGISVGLGDLVKLTDLAASAAGALFASVYGGSPAMQAGQSFIVSVVARVLSQNIFQTSMSQMTPGAKNQFIVGILSAIIAAVRKQSVGKSVLGGVSADLLGEQVIAMLKMDDSSLFR